MLDVFREVVLCDFEFGGGPGERPDVVCLVARLLKSGETLRVWRDQMSHQPPYPIDDGVLFVAFVASAELGCHRALGWPLPRYVLDLAAEFKLATCGLPTAAGNRSLLAALTYYGLDAIASSEKKEMQQLAMRGGPWTDEEREALLTYCEGDVDALARLLPVMLPKIDLPQALLRGRYMVAASAMEHSGAPIDVGSLAQLREHWTGIQDALVADIDKDFGVYEGRTFKIDRFEQYLARAGIPWGRTETGRLSLDNDTFREAAKAYPQISPLRELRSALSEMRLNDLAVGHDGRNRTPLWAFSSRTSRNQPSNTKFIFGPSVWLRGLIKPPPGYGVAYIDWSQQEWGIAAALSGDANMMAAYQSGDPYLAFAKQAGAVPQDATKQSHPAQRDLFKACVLAVQYGMGEKGLAEKLGKRTIVARDLLRAHRETYRKFWRWSDAAVNFAMLHGYLFTVFGWRIHVAAESNPRSLANFPMQANGAEVLRLACCLATEAGIEVCAPIHDAILICAPLDRLEADIAAARACMAEASRIVLGGFELGTDVHVVRYPERYMDGRGVVMWDTVGRLIAARAAIPEAEIAA